jgi:hypothetical protein
MSNQQDSEGKPPKGLNLVEGQPWGWTSESKTTYYTFFVVTIITIITKWEFESSLFNNNAAFSSAEIYKKMPNFICRY